MNKYIEYVTSKSIREYLNKINFEPSGYEAAYIVYTNQTLSLSKKFELWKEIIETYPDEELKAEFKNGSFSFCEFLNDYMEIQSMLCEKLFQKEENAVYTSLSGVLLDTDNSTLLESPFYFCNIYSDLDLCIEDEREKTLSKYDIRKHYIKTSPDDADYCSIYADIYKDKIISVGEIYILDDTAKKINEYIEKYSPIIPFPFKKGDIIYSARYGAECKLLVFKDYFGEYIKVFKAEDDESKSFLIKGLDIDYVNEE